MRNVRYLFFPTLFLSCVLHAGTAETKPPAEGKDLFEDIYGSYKPDFLDKSLYESRGGPDEEEVRLSSEKSFFTLNRIQESDRAYALVKAAKQKEVEGEHREALEIYQKVIDKYPDALYRVSPYGVFIPISHYCQLRLLSFPPADLKHYRAKHDARASEAFTLAREKNSPEGLAYVRDFMLATSYGAKSLLVLGDGALDRGHYLEALEYYTTVRACFPDPDARTPELDLKVAYCRKMLGDQAKPSKQGKAAPPASSDMRPEALKAFRKVVGAARREGKASFAQLSSAPNVSADDYMLMPPTTDPLGLKKPVWTSALPGSRLDFIVYSNPVVTKNSVVYRHKNIVYCRSILNGRMRWVNKMGGRVTWQSWRARQYPHEDVLVQDGMVYTALYQGGQNLVALDETTGQMRWAYGPMAATTRDEANLRLEAAPAGGPMTVYAGYIQDNIEGATHTDTEYGVIAFESTTGRIRWRRRLCRLPPGLFSTGFTNRIRNRIRSFSSPPLYHQGTVYHVTNAGAIAALDALSGRVKWIMRYPYYMHPQAVHDATRGFGKGGSTKGPHSPSFWYGQRPMLIGEDLYVLPIDSKFMYKLDRRSGKVHWTAHKVDGNSYFLGPLPGGQLVVANSGRSGRTDAEGPITLLDPRTGKVAARLADPVGREPQPSVRLRYSVYGSGRPVQFGCLGHDGANYQITARPFLSSSGQLIVGGAAHWGYRIWGFGTNLALYNLNEKGRPVTARRRYFSPELLGVAANAIKTTPRWLKYLEKMKQSGSVKSQMEMTRAIVADHPPGNKHPSFLPFSRVTFERYGTRCELRFGPRSVSMVYDLDAVKRQLEGRKDAEGLFGAAEVAVGEGRIAAAAELMQRCLKSLPSEDTDFRTLVNQQLYQAHKHLARGGVRAKQSEEELTHCLGMSRTATSLGDEIEMRFAIADAYERKGDLRNAGTQLRSLISAYAGYGYPVSSLVGANRERISEASASILRRGGRYVAGIPYTDVLKETTGLLTGALPVYFGALSPLEKDLKVRADEWAAARLNRLRMTSESFGAELEKAAVAGLAKRPAAERLARLLEFPGTRAAQKALEELLAETERETATGSASLAGAAKQRKMFWGLADKARIAGLSLPDPFRTRLLASPSVPVEPTLASPFRNRIKDMAEKRGTVWLVLERKGDRSIQPDYMFLGGRVRKKIDNKFVLYCTNLASGEVIWKAREPRADAWFDEIRLHGQGDEPGFFEAYVHHDIVVVHGMFDVLAFGLKDGRLRWRYKVPFAFDIRHTVRSGDLMILAGKTETVALYLGTNDPRGEVAWQEREEGDVYGAPYIHGDRLVSVRSMPFNLTTRYRSTGRLMGRLSLPDLSRHSEHPLLENGPTALPLAHDGKQLAVTDGEYYIMLDVERMRVVWKRLIDANDPTQRPPMRLAMNGDFLVVVKKDYDANAIHMLSSRTGQLLWRTDRKNRKSPRPIHSMLIRDGKLYGIRPHAGQGFYFVGMDCRTGRDLFRPNEQKGYGAVPDVRLRAALHGDGMVAEIRDRQDFELKAFSIKDGKLAHEMYVKAAGRFGVHGRASATVQNGMMALLGGNELHIASRK